MSTKIRIAEDRYEHGKKSVEVYTTETLGEEGRLAGCLIERWGLITAEADGEDSAGRAKVRTTTPDELVTRAFDIAERFWAMARARGHVVVVPDLGEINAEYDAKIREERATKLAKQEAQRA